MKNIHVIATDNKPSRLHFDSKLFISPNYQNSKSINSIVQGKNIYITSDEEIKGGEWCFEVYNGDSWATSPKFIDDEGNAWWLRKANATDIAGCPTTKKIILTTDQDLIKDGVQAIDDEFLEWFVKNPSCEKVEVEIQSTLDKVDGHYHDLWEIIIPKEESINYRQTGASEFVVKTIIKNTIILKEESKQETLEEVAERFKEFCSWGCKKSFIEGAKWQAERSYSEEEVLELLIKSEEFTSKYSNRTDLTTWFEQFKNKKNEKTKITSTNKLLN